MTGLRRALWALGVAGFIAGAVPLVLALSAPDDINDPALTAVFGPLIGWSFIGTGLFAWYRRPGEQLRRAHGRGGVHVVRVRAQRGPPPCRLHRRATS